MRQTDSEPFKIGIVGSYGGLNLGDEAILQSILKQIRDTIPAEITVFSRNAEDTKQRHAVERAIPARRIGNEEILPEIRRLDLLILGGGGILFDVEAKEFLREIELALEHNIPVMTYAIGAGPLKLASSQSIVRQTLNRVQLITVRDKYARQCLEQCGVNKSIVVTADPALLLKPEPVTEPIFELLRVNGRKLIGLSVREPGNAAPDLNVYQHHQLVADAADYMVDRYDADMIFVPLEPQTQDLQHSHGIISQMMFAERAHVLKTKLGAAQVLEIMSRFDFVVGMRLHFLIFAILQNVAFAALPYSSKVHGLLEALQIDAPPIQKINAGRLIAHIDREWNQKEEIKQKLQVKLPQLQAQARQTHELLVRLLHSNRTKEGFDLNLSS